MLNVNYTSILKKSSQGKETKSDIHIYNSFYISISTTLIVVVILAVVVMVYSSRVVYCGQAQF